MFLSLSLSLETKNQFKFYHNYPLHPQPNYPISLHAHYTLISPRLISSFLPEENATPPRAQNLKFFNCGLETRTLNGSPHTVISPLWRNNYLLMTGQCALTIAVYSFAPCNPPRFTDSKHGTTRSAPSTPSPLFTTNTGTNSPETSIIVDHRAR